MAFARRVLLACCVLAVSACATTGGMGWYARHVDDGTALDVPHVLQASRADCGIAALASVMAFYRGPVDSQQALRDRYPPAAPEGYSLGELRDIARAHGFVAFVVPGDKPSLRSQLNRGRPVIVPLEVDGVDLRRPGVIRLPARLVDRASGSGYAHYMVVVGIDDERHQVIALDPARGPVALDLGDFAAAWERMNHAALLVGLASGAESDETRPAP